MSPHLSEGLPPRMPDEAPQYLNTVSKLLHYTNYNNYYYYISTVSCCSLALATLSLHSPTISYRTMSTVLCCSLDQPSPSLHSPIISYRTT